MSAKRPRRRGPWKGRSLVAIGLVVFIAVTSLVVWRRSVGVKATSDIAIAQNEKRSLETERVTLERDLKAARSRSRVVAEAERRLGLHVASDSQTRVLAEPGRVP